MLKAEVDDRAGIVTLMPDGPLAAENYRAVSDAVTPQVRHAGRLTALLIQANPFPAWRDLSDFLSCMRFLQEHGDELRRVGAVTDSPANSFMAQLSAYFDRASVRQFGAGQLRRAQMWVHEAVAEEPPPAVDPPMPGADALDAAGDDALEPEASVVSVEELESGTAAEQTAEEDDWFV